MCLDYWYISIYSAIRRWMSSIDIYNILYIAKLRWSMCVVIVVFFFIFTYFLVLYHLQLNIFASFVCRNGQNSHIISLSFLLRLYRIPINHSPILFRYNTCNGIRVFRDFRYRRVFFNDILLVPYVATGN